MKKLALLLLVFTTPAFAQQSQSVSWDASPTAGIAGYNVYRGRTASDCVGATQTNCTKLNAALVTGLTYVDNTLPRAGGMFVYTVRAVDSGSPALESDNSNLLTVILPPQKPEPPSNLRKTP